MAINATGINQCMQQNHQFMNLWSFFFEDDNGDIEYNTQSVTLPQKMIEQEMLTTGEHTIKGTTKLDTFSISVRETTDFKVSKYFDKWWASIYDDEKQQFKVVIGQDTRYKNAYFSFESSTTNPLLSKAYAASAIGQGAALASSALGLGGVTTGINLAKKRIIRNNINKASVKKETKLYAFENVRLLGRGEISPTVDATEPLTWDFTFTFTGYSPIVDPNQIFDPEVAAARQFFG